MIEDLKKQQIKKNDNHILGNYKVIYLEIIDPNPNKETKKGRKEKRKKERIACPKMYKYYVALINYFYDEKLLLL